MPIRVGQVAVPTCKEYSSLNINARAKFAPLVRGLFPQNEQSIIFDNSHLEQSSFDVVYLTELDPMWHDDELTFIFNPDVDLPARAACAADCAAATAGSL